MDRLCGPYRSRYLLPVDYLKMLFKEDFRKLTSVCLKMLFRKSTRKRFALLVFAFLFMLGFNTGSYVKKFHRTEMLKKEILAEKAFKIFFLRMNTRNTCTRFLNRQQQTMDSLGAAILDKSFIYQNNIFIHFIPDFGFDSIEPAENFTAMGLLYDVLDIDRHVKDYFASMKPQPYNIKVRNIYIDYNGTRLDTDSILSRDEELKGDFIDIADAIRGNLKGKRLEAFNQIKNRISDNLNRVSFNEKNEPNPYLSRLQAIVPANLLYIMTNLRNDNTTDILELSEAVRYGKDSRLEVFKDYLEFPKMGPVKVLYGDIEEVYPRYLPLVISDLLIPRLSWLLYQEIRLKNDFMNYLDQLHFKGHYLFSYEKSHIIKDKVKKINDDIRTNHIYFYLTDLSLGIVFPFMMSLFAFIHLKTEISFLLMYKNRSREILFIFWLLPVLLMLLIKGGVIFVYWFYLFGKDFNVHFYVMFPLMGTFLATAAIFYPVNKWCFVQFTSNNLSLYELHKGR